MGFGLGLGPAFFGFRGGGAPAVPDIVETAPLYAENFNAYADNTSLITAAPTGPGWTAISGAGASNAAKDSAHVIGGAVTKRTTGAVGDFTSPGSYLLYPPALPPSKNAFIQGRIKNVAGSTAGLVVAAVDERSRISVNYGSGAFQAFKHDVSLGTAGTNVKGATRNLTARFNGGTHNAFKAPVDGDLVTIRYFNDKVYLDLNGSRILFSGVAAPGAADVSAAPTPSGTKVGFSTNNFQYDSWDDIKIGPLTGMMTLNEPLKAYPRIQGLGGYPNGAADITFSGTYEGVAPTGLHWALFDPETGAVLKDWAWVSSSTISGGNWSAVCRVPCGLNGRKGYRIGFRAANDTWNYVQSHGPNSGVFYVAYTILLVGQSNSAGIITTPVGSPSIPDHPGGIHASPANPPVVTAALRTATTSWEVSTAEGTGFDNMSGLLTAALSQALGLPVYLSKVAVGARSAVFCGPLGAEWDYLTTHIANNGGAFDALYLSQGEAEVEGADTTPAAQWKAVWRDTNIPAYRALSGQPGGAVVPVFYALTGRVLATTISLAQRDANATVLRKVQYELKDEVSDCYLIHHYLGIPMADDFHYQNSLVGRGKLNQMIAWAMAYRLVGGASWPYDSRGPYVSSASRAGAVITIPLVMNGATSLTALSGADGATAGDVNALTDWQVSGASDFSSLLTISSAVISGNSVVITLSADPGGPVWVRTAPTNTPTLTSWVFGSYTSGPASGLSIAMEPVVKPIQTAS